MSDPIFQGTLQDMIKGIRSNKKDPSSFISKEIADIKTELRSTDPFLKAEAVISVMLDWMNSENFAEVYRYIYKSGSQADISADDRL